MRKKFVKTQNVKNFISLMNHLNKRQDGIPGMGLVYGEPGLGKTQTILWWATQNDSVFIRGANLMTGRWFLEELAEELGEAPYYRTSDLFKQCVNLLKLNPRTIIVDEVDYLTNDCRVIETLRDIHDKTNVPVVLVGMGKVDKKLMRYKHLYDRISEKVKFEVFTKADIKSIVEELSEVVVTDCAIQYIYNYTGRFRQIVKLINKFEQVAKANGISTIDDMTIKEFIDYE